MTALFIIIFMDQLEKNKDHFPAVVGIVIAIICLIVFGSQNFMLPSLIISSMILQKLKNDAETYLQEQVTQAVITVPAYFTC